MFYPHYKHLKNTLKNEYKVLYDTDIVDLQLLLSTPLIK